MENTLELRGLVLPSNYVSIDDEEMEFVDGSWNWGTFFKKVVVGAVVGAIVAACPVVVAGVGIAVSLAGLSVSSVALGVGLGLSVGAGVIGTAALKGAATGALGYVGCELLGC